MTDCDFTPGRVFTRSIAECPAQRKDRFMIKSMHRVALILGLAYFTTAAAEENWVSSKSEVSDAPSDLVAGTKLWDLWDSLDRDDARVKTYLQEEIDSAGIPIEIGQHFTVSRRYGMVHAEFLLGSKRWFLMARVSSGPNHEHISTPYLLRHDEPGSPMYDGGPASITDSELLTLLQRAADGN